MFTSDITKKRTRSGFRYARLRDSSELFAHMAPDWSGVSESALYLAVLMESIEEEPLGWTFEQAIAYLAAKATIEYLRNTRQKKTKNYTLYHHSRDDFLLFFIGSTYQSAFPGELLPEILHTRLVAHVCNGDYSDRYRKVLWAVIHMISNGVNEEYSSLASVRVTLVKNIDFLRASKSVTESVIESHKALTYILALFH